MTWLRRISSCTNSFCFSESHSYGKSQSTDKISLTQSSSNFGSIFTLNSTAQLDRTGDHVYQCTTNVAFAVRNLLHAVQDKKVDEYLDLVKAVGLELRGLLASVDDLITTLPIWSHKEIEMAHRVLSKDMSALIQDMRNAQKYSQTTVAKEYARAMLGAAHVLVIDAKNLLDTVDSVRLRIILSDQNSSAASSNTNSSIIDQVKEKKV